MSLRWAAAAAAVAVVASAAAALVHARSLSGVDSRTLGTLEVAAGIGLRCTLPLAVNGRLATVSLPDGRLTAAAVQPGPYDQGDGYIRGRWLPVGPWAVSPDGRSYAYLTSTSGAPGQGAATTLFLHDVAGGHDRPAWTGRGGGARLVGWTAGGVFLALGPDLWLVDPARPGVAHRVGPNPPAPPRLPAASPPSPVFVRIGNDAAWALTSSQMLATGIAANDLVVRMDLADGTVSPWFQAPSGSTLWLLGLDGGGHPLLAVADPMRQAGRVWYQRPARGMMLLAGRDRAVPIPMPDPELAPDQGFADARGVWIAGADSLWLYRDDRLTRVATIPVRLRPAPPRLSPPPGEPGPAPGPAAVVLGPCA